MVNHRRFKAGDVVRVSIYKGAVFGRVARVWPDMTVVGGHDFLTIDVYASDMARHKEVMKVWVAETQVQPL